MMKKIILEVVFIIVILSRVVLANSNGYVRRFKKK